MSDIIHQGNETSNGTPLPPAVVYHGGEPGATLPAVREGLVPYPPSGGPDITSILQALRRRWFLALSLGLLAASLVAVAAWFGLHPSYTVSAQVDIAAKKPRTLTPTGDAYESDVEYSTYKQTQVMRIKSRPVLNAAVTRPEVKDLHLFNAGSDPAASLESGLKIDAHEGSEIVGISLNGPNPDQLLVLVNAVTHAYLEDTAQSERRRQLDRIAELDKLAAQSGGQLRGQQETWHQLADQLGTSDPQAMIQKQLSLQSALDNLRKEQTELDFSQRRLQAQRAAAEVKARLAGQLELPAALVNAALDADPSAKYYYARLVKLKEILADYEQNARNSDEPSLVRARQETADTEKALADRRTALQAQLQEEVRQKTRLELEAQVAQLQSEEASGATREQTVTAEINRLVKELERVGTLTTKFRLLDDKIKDGEGQAKKMVDEANGLKIELQTPPRISLYQEAAIEKMDIKRRLLALTLGPLGAFAAVCLCVSWWDIRARRIQSVQEVALGLGVKVMGALPALPANRASHLVVTGEAADNTGLNFLESVDAIRTLLLHEANTRGTRTVMVASGVAREGKTTLATHLAGSLARAGCKTLLIDCDLRRPSVHPLFDLPAQPGLCEVLLQQAEAASAARPTTIPGLAVLPAGRWNRLVLQSLAQGEAGKLFEQLKQDYDFLVIDSHPVLLAADSLLVGQNVDAVILSLLRDVSQAPVAYAACQRLTTLGIRVLGAVVHGMPQKDLYQGSYRYAPVAAGV